MAIAHYFVDVTAISTGGEVSSSGIIDAGPQSNNHGFTVSGLVASTGIVAYKVYWVLANATPIPTVLTSANYFIVPAGIGSISSADPRVGTIFQAGTGATSPSGTRGALSRILAYDLVLKAWSVIDLPVALASLRQARIPGGIPVTVMGSFGSPDSTGVIGVPESALLRWQAGDATWNVTQAGVAGTAIAWSVRTPLVYAQAPSTRTFFRRLLIVGKVPAGNAASITCTVTVEGTDGPSIVTKEFDFGSGEFQCVMDVGLTGQNAYATLTGSGIITIEGIDWHVMPKPAGPTGRAF